MTRFSQRQISEETHESVRACFSVEELGDLAWIIATINAWNRVNIALQTAPGGYQPASTLE
ncbi:carboxymuconolactone decarboxylase family protein [Aureliella helgolandensis]|uniref:hypothetical protein n=1 Tax=Aureliella helgolandensis TaxID=2527968 RepID=UPI0011A1F96B|nr:hypothetical protein [Aureliella helgolandensis]